MREYLAGLILSQLRNEKPQDLPSDIDVYEIIDISARNHMDYLVLGALARTDNLPEAAVEIIRSRVQNSVIRTLMQVTELNKMVDAFEKAEIKNQPMKGSCMKFMYPSPEMREMSDIDVLVDSDKMEEAGQILNDLGYKMGGAAVHHDEYYKPPFMCIEVHSAMYDKSTDVGQYNYFKSFSKAVLRKGMKYTYDFNLNDFYVYMLAHMAKHFYLAGCGIRNLVDIYVYLEKYGKELDRTYIKQELEKCGILEFSNYVEELAYIWLEGRNSSPFYDDLFQYMMDCGIFGKKENELWHRLAKDKKDNKKPRAEKIRLKKMYYFPSVSYMVGDYPWLEKLPFLLPVAWCCRAFKSIFGISKAQRAERKIRHELVNSVDIEKAEVNQDIYSKMKFRFKH